MDRRLALLEFFGSTVFLEAAIWTSIPLCRLACGIIAGLWLTRIYFRYTRNCRRPKATPRIDSWTLILLSIVLALVASGIAYSIGVWSPSIESFTQRSILDWTTVKLPTVILQQLLFQFVLIPTIYMMCGKIKATIFYAAALFGLLHLPNPLLVALTFSIGLLWFSISVSRPRLVALTVSHLILAVTVANVADEYVLDMRVGEVCFQKWPYQVQGQSDQQSIVVYPRAINGSLESVTQKNDHIQLSGYVFDEVRHKAPSKVFVVLGTFDPEDVSGNNWQAQKVLVATKVHPDGNFKLDFDSASKDESVEVRIFAQHDWGWSYPINDSARIEWLAHDPTGETIRLYPREFHGNIGHVKQRADRTDLIGWGFALKQKKLLDQLWVLTEQRLQAISLERRPRQEIADYYSEPSLLNCGFVSRIPFVIASEKPPVYLRNSHGELERMPMELAGSRSNRTAERKSNLR